MFGRSVDIEDVDNFEELLKVLSKRRYWIRIKPEIIKHIFKNSQEDLQTLKDFITFSELTGLVQNNFISIANDEMPTSMTLALFSVTLERLGAQQAEEFITRSEEYDGPENDIFIGTSELAYKYSILCNPYMLPSYLGIAILCAHIRNQDSAIEWCEKYKQAEARLLNAEDDNLSDYNKSLKSEIGNMRKKFDEFMSEMLNGYNS